MSADQQNSPWDAMNAYVDRHGNDALHDPQAAEAAFEYGFLEPDAMTMEYLHSLAAQARTRHAGTSTTPNAVVISPSCALLGLAVLRGFESARNAELGISPASAPAQADTTDAQPEDEGTMPASIRKGMTLQIDRKPVELAGHLNCIEPNITSQDVARQTFQRAGFPSQAFRFVPANPVQVISRMAASSYDLIVAESAFEDMPTLVRKALSALRVGGMIVLLDTLLDGLVNEDEHRDSTVRWARSADAELRALPGVTYARLPLGAGMTVLTKLAS